MTQGESRENHHFQAEVSKLLHLMVHSVYTEKEIFLRELVSNASDACDKLRYEAVHRSDLIGPDERLAIRIRSEKAAGTLTVADNGIGMDRGELIDNLGTIARSGTRAFLDRLKEGPEGASLIGQFGVGFYSAFMVADQITVTSRKAGEDNANVWQSDGAGGFTIAGASPEAAERIGRGTEIVLKLKDDARQFLEPWEIERIVRTYSDHILFPVELIAPAEDEEGKEDAAQAAKEPRQINSASALWQRSKSEVKPEEYTEVYRTVTGNFDQPAMTIHYKAEGRQAYAVLLFVPEKRPFDLYDVDRKGRVKLYVRRVYITDDAGLLPAYLRFVRGVVDSEDVPLNISREMLQNNPMVAQIRKAVTTRVLSELESLAGKDNVKFEATWEEFGAVIKEGLYEDFERRDQLMKLARFHSTAGSGWRSLTDYVASLKENQTAIYYLAGDSLDRLKASPQLEAARARGIEVLLLTDPIDNFWTAGVPGFEGKPLKSLTHGDVDLSLVPLLEEAKPAPEAAAEDGEALLGRLREALKDKVSEVVASKRLVESPVCLVAPNQGPDRGLDKLLARQDRAVGLKPVLEINTGHPLVAAVSRRIGMASGEEAEDLAMLLLDQAHILDGETPADPALFVKRMNRLVLAGLGS